MTSSVSAVVCVGCGAANSALQCPLCQAEAHTTQGFFCSQKCFAKSWLQHRDDFHKRGVVRERKSSATVCSDANAAGPVPEVKTRAKKRPRGAVAAPSLSPFLSPPWAPLPGTGRYDALRGVVPPLAVDCPRAVVGACVEGIREGFWPSALAAAHYAAAATRHDAALRVLVVAGGTCSAHAFAWAARCAGLGGAMRMAVTLSGLPEPRSQYFTSQKRVIVATEAIVGHAGGGEASLWLEGPASLLVTLPDVVAPTDLQGVNTRGIFFVSKRARKHTGTSGASVAEDIPNKGRGKVKKGKNDKPSAKLEVSYPQSNTDEEPTHEVAAAVRDVCCDEVNAPFLWQPELLEKTPESVEEIDEDSKTNRETSRHSRHVPHYVRPLTARMDNDVSSALANGDTAAALDHLTRVFSTTPGYFEEILFNSLRCDWGAMGVVHAHHRLAYVMRSLADRSGNFSSPKGATMADMVFRAMVPLVHTVPALQGCKDNAGGSVATVILPEKKKHKGELEKEDKVSAQEHRQYFNFYSSLPNVQLQATIAYLSVYEPSPAALDTLAEAWGVTHYIKAGGLTMLNHSRKDIIHRLRSRYRSRLGTECAEFLVTLMHILYDTVAIYSLPLEEVARRLQWDLTLASDVGSLTSFLELCGLWTPSPRSNTEGAGAVKGLSSDGNSNKVKNNLSSRQVRPPSRTEILRSHEVRAAATTTKNSKSKDAVHPSSCYIPLPWLPFPMSGKREKEAASLQQVALEEILMAMPREPRPMYIGDVGNLIGKWNGFNSRFGGVLGTTLSEFLLKHPNEFKIVGGLVSRVKAGRSEPVRIRFDNDAENAEDQSDSDNDGRASRIRKLRDHALLTGIGNKKQNRQRKAMQLEKDLPARARKKRAIKEFNKQRFNKNYKPIDPSVRVPGYVKHGPRKIKGRGKKVNMHAFKRN